MFNQDANTAVAADNKSSKINAAGLINISLEEQWKKVYLALDAGNYAKMNRNLDCIWLILGGDEEETSQPNKDYAKIELDLHEAGSMNHKKVGFETYTDEERLNMAKQYIHLRNKALFLRRLQNAQGKGTAYKSDDDEDFD